ncbi:choice-of-anchor D domain-containing protein [Candidatus Albibeggiatoa sp. nov. NOAA]|uniref:NHL domain-containing protein n=1 Tax=Candidatus Albibeggiatoa sp. nov. NOAA TaxID=3162724 RepID=UPI0032FAD9A2|nr:choice-of-anchor D domain-containing protein [Thiotrichaceae bacterium]
MRLIFYALLLCLTFPVYAEEPPSFLFSWGEEGDQPTQFENPTRINQDRQGNLYVLDKGNFRIQKFTAQGQSLATWGKEGNLPGQFVNPTDIAVDNIGTVYVLDAEIPRIQMFNPEGLLLRQWEAKDSSFIAELADPQAIEVDGNGYVYVLDTGNFRVVVFTPDGDFNYTIGQRYDPNDLEASNAEGRFIRPVDMAFNRDQRLLYIVDSEKNALQYFSTDGNFLGTFGGNSEEDSLNQPNSVSVDAKDNIYVTNAESHVIHKFSPQGELLSVWGGEGETEGLFDRPSGIATLGQSIYISDALNERVQVFGQSYSLQLGKAVGSGFGSIVSSEGQVLCDATCKQVKLNFPQVTTLSLTATPDENSIFMGWEGDCTGSEPTINVTVEQETQCRAKFKDSALLTVNKVGFGVVLATDVAGETLACTPSCRGGYQQGDTVTLTAVAGDDEAFAYWVGDCLGIENPKSVTLDEAKSCTAIFSQYISTAAGTGTAGLTEDTTHASLVQMNSPYAVTIIDEGELLIAERDNHLIRSVNKLGTTEIFAGTGVAGYSGDGYEATSAKLNLPSDITSDQQGNIYIADTGNHVIRMITPDGVITTVAGTPRISGYSDGTLNAFDARFNSPMGIEFAGGSLFIADTGNSLIRQLTGETVLTLAGNGVAGYLDHDDALQGQLNRPQDVMVSPEGTLYIADTNNRVIRELVDGALQTIAGNGTSGAVAEGSLALESAMGTPVGLANGRGGVTYIADSEYNAIWMLSNRRIYKLIGLGENADYQLASAAGLNSPMGLTVSKENIYVAEAGNHKVRLIGALPEGTRTFFSLPPFADDPIQLTANVPVNTPIDTNINIYNIGLTDLTIDFISLEGKHATEFSVVTPFPINLSQGTNAPLTVRCAPTDIGARKALLRLSTTDEELPEVRYELYCANTPVFASRPDNGGLIDFNTVGVGQPSEKRLLIGERGAGDVQVTSAEIVGEFADQFTVYSLEHSFPVVIADGSEPQELFVQCNPQAIEKYEATLVLATNDPTQSQPAYHLSCQGVDADTEFGFLHIDTSGGGVVERCGESCTKSFALDTLVSLIAKPESGWGFLGWSGSCDAEGKVLIAEQNECVAHFAPLSPQSGDIDGLYVNYGQTSENLRIEQHGSISGGKLAGKNTNEGWVSNVELEQNSRIEGGNISGFNVNNGTMCDLRITNYSEVSGGEFCGEIENDGILHDVEINETGKVSGEGRFEGVVVNNGEMCGTLELGEDTYILGGELGCEIEGDRDKPAIIGKSKIQENAVLENVCLTATVELGNNVSLANNVTYNRNTGDLSLQSFCIEPEELETFDQSRMRGTEEQAFATFDNEHLEALAEDAFEAMTEVQIAEFEQIALEGMKLEQFEKLPPQSLKGLDRNNMGGLPPEAIGRMEREHLDALDIEDFIELPEEEIAEFMTNFNADIFTVDDIDEYLPEDWSIEQETGELIPPVGAKLACKALPPPQDLPPNVILPDKKFDLNTDLSLGGKKADNTILQDFNSAADDDSNFNQQDDGVVLGQISGKQYAFIVDVNNVQQLDTDAETAVTSDERGQFIVTTPERQQFPLLPAPKSPTALATVLGDDSQVELNEWGDVLLKVDGEYIVVIFGSEIEQAEGETAGFYPPDGENTRAIREGRVVYDDGTSQTTYPSVLYPETFIGLLEQIEGAAGVVYNVDGSYSLSYNGQSVSLLPNYGATTQGLDEWERIDPSLALVDGSLQYKVQDTGNNLLVTATLTISYN